MNSFIRYIKQHKLKASIVFTLLYWGVWWLLSSIGSGSPGWRGMIELSIWNILIVWWIYHNPKDDPEFIYVSNTHRVKVIEHIAGLGFKLAYKNDRKSRFTRLRGWLKTDRITIKKNGDLLQIFGKQQFLEPLYDLRIQYKSIRPQASA